MNKKAVILLSGGLDSTTCLAIAKEKGYDCYALSFSFGQKHSGEVECAKKIAKKFQVKDHKILNLALNELGGSSLVDPDMLIPDFSDENKIPSTYVPARNTIFLSVALGWAESLEAYDIFFGANYVDYPGYPDCRPEYIAAFENLANLATKAAVEGSAQFKIHAPLLRMRKSDIIREGARLGVDYSMTVSCYRADAHDGRACGSCDPCTYRKNGFQDAALADPTIYY